MIVVDMTGAMGVENYVMRARAFVVLVSDKMGF